MPQPRQFRNSHLLLASLLSLGDPLVLSDSHAASNPAWTANRISSSWCYGSPTWASAPVEAARTEIVQLCRGLRCDCWGSRCVCRVDTALRQSISRARVRQQAKCPRQRDHGAYHISSASQSVRLQSVTCCLVSGVVRFVMVCIRQATLDDLLAMQRCNLLCLPENYQLKVSLAPACFRMSSRTFASLSDGRHCAVLLLSHSVLAATATRGGGLWWKDCGLCPRQNVRNLLSLRIVLPLHCCTVCLH